MKMNKDNYEEFLIAYLEDMLSPQERTEVESLLRVDPGLESELKCFSRAILVPDQSVVFPDKEKLKRYTGQHAHNEKVIRMTLFRRVPYSVSVAASLLIILGIYFILFQYIETQRQNALLTALEKKILPDSSKSPEMTLSVPKDSQAFELIPPLILTKKTIATSNSTAEESVKTHLYIPDAFATSLNPDEPKAPVADILPANENPFSAHDSSVVISEPDRSDFTENPSKDSQVVMISPPSGNPPPAPAQYLVSEKRVLNNFWDALGFFGKQINKKSDGLISLNVKRTAEGELFFYSFGIGGVFKISRKTDKTINV